MVIAASSARMMPTATSGRSSPGSRRRPAEMAHIVMCWELGGDLGHVARMRPLAESLRLRGHRVTFIVREPLAAARLLDPAHYTWLQAPVHMEAVSPAFAPTRNF